MVVPSALSEYAGVTVIDEERKWLSSSCSSEKMWLYTRALQKLE